MSVKAGIGISAVELAERLELDPPTTQQRDVIEAPLAPALVVAGAGSGKTETMANRVVWLVANELVRPDQILGLTFTRKAAGSLADRITRRIDQLRGWKPIPDAAGRVIDFEQATVSTYNSFASAIFRDNALRIGREPESVLLNDASAWQLARRVVVSSSDDRLVDLARSVDQITEAVLELSAELGENVADPDAVAAFAERFLSLAELPHTDGKAKAAPYASVTKATADLSGLPVIAALAQRFAVEKQHRGLIQFSDQVALALAVGEAVPSVVADYRDRYPVVLLDEYQDTSVVQTRLLSTLFAGHGVMAVGDPHQSIYGWRGASAANLSRFAVDFGRGETVEQYPLSVSWRNAERILDSANAIVSRLRADHERPLDPRPGVPAGEVNVSFSETIDDEATAVATWLSAGFAAGTEKPTAAILFRQRRHMSLFGQALEKAGLRYHVLGIGGLLSTPEIVDLVSALRVVHDPTAGSELVRLLSGARWAIGPKDLRALASVAGWLHSHDWRQQALSDEVKQRMRDSVAADDGRSIVDALDFVGEAPETHGQLTGFTPVGLERLRAAAVQLAFLRSRAGLDLLDFVRLVEQELLLDIEVAANGTSGLGPANLYAFHDELEGFLASDDQADLGSFLGWLDRAARRDDMGPRGESGEAGVVQLLTIHGSKGLEWDLVAVPRLVVDELPAQSREGTGWVRFAKLPYDFRGDSSELPVLDWQGAASQQQFDSRLGEFKTALAERHQDEERRLGYVAITRARDALLLTGAFWSDGTKPRGPSPFLRELEAAGLIPELPQGTEYDENPLDFSSVTLEWPLDPLGERRASVEVAASAVRSVPAGSGTDAGRWERDLTLLLLERDRAAAAMQRVPLPARVAASRFKDFVTDPIMVATALRRPMPERPYRATRLGTQFHSWVEARYGVRAPSDFLDAAPEELDDQQETESVPADLAALTATFERSPWAALRPVDVEIEIQLPFDGQVLICKIDAVYSTVDRSGVQRYEIVDWKTGKAPKDAKDLEEKQFQLALYRLAYARWRGIDPSLIDALFYYVAEDRMIRPDHLFDEKELIAKWRSALTRG